MGVNYYRPLHLPEKGDLTWQEAILQCLEFAFPLLMSSPTTTAEPEPTPTMETEPEHTVDAEPELMPTTDPETKPVPAMEPEPAASFIPETKPATQSDQVCEPVHTFVPVGVLVELGDKVSGHPHPPASKFNLSQSGLIYFLMTSCSQALPHLLVLLSSTKSVLSPSTKSVLSLMVPLSLPLPPPLSILSSSLGPTSAGSLRLLLWWFHLTAQISLGLLDLQLRFGVVIPLVSLLHLCLATSRLHLGPSSSRLHWAPSSLQLCLGRTSPCLHLQLRLASPSTGLSW